MREEVYTELDRSTFLYTKMLMLLVKRRALIIMTSPFIELKLNEREFAL